MNFGFEYFCGANVIIDIDGVEALEAAGLSFQASSTRRPIYGYSSELFDTTAMGQILIQGSLLINYVHQDYLFELINIANTGIIPQQLQLGNTNALRADALINDYLANDASTEVMQALRQKYWGSGRNGSNNWTDSGNIGQSLLSRRAPVRINATFGERNSNNAYTGSTGYTLEAVHFIGRGQRIVADENNILEEYSFFARQVYALNTRKTIVGA